MNHVLGILVFTGCFLLMAAGLLLANKALRKGCSIDPDSCACRKEGKDPAQCDKEKTGND